MQMKIQENNVSPVIDHIRRFLLHKRTMRKALIIIKFPNNSTYCAYNLSSSGVKLWEKLAVS